MTGQRQRCEVPRCNEPACTWVPETSKFACESHAPVGCEVRR